MCTCFAVSKVTASGEGASSRPGASKAAGMFDSPKSMWQAGCPSSEPSKKCLVKRNRISIKSIEKKGSFVYSRNVKKVPS